MIKKIEWEAIHQVWKEYLWKGRVSEIKPTNGLKFLGGYDKRIEEYTPTFFGAFVGNKCVGVNSGHATNENEYRSRGIYIIPKYRNQGFSQQLFKCIEIQSVTEGRDILWSMPRESALPAYEKFGFEKVSAMFGSMEFGPNCFVFKRIKR